MNPEMTVQDNDTTVQDLLSVLQELVVELHPAKSRSLELSLDSSLDADVGLDSLARVELIARLERRFHLVLPQTVFAEAETPRDLLRAITTARGRSEYLETQVMAPVMAEKVTELPQTAQTLIEVLEWHVNHHPHRMHIRIIDAEGESDSLTYAQLWQGAQTVAAGLQQQGVQPGETVAIMLPSGKEYFFSFFAVLLTGAIPVPIYPPVRRSQLEDHLRRHNGILNNCTASLLISMPEAKVIAQLLKSQVESLRRVVTVAELSAYSASYIRPAIGPLDIAFLQYTSGSTGNPKGVVLTHANLLANIRVMGEAVAADSSDIFISWLPLYHDMGLIGAWLGSMYFAVLLVVMSPLSFLTRPQRWLWAIHQYRGTLSAAPNFGYELCLKRISDEDIQQLDLSSWRCAFNGAEPVSPDTIKRFTHRFKPFGFRAEAMLPVYGLAESAVGLAFPPLDREPLVDCVQRDLFTHTREAVPADEQDENALCFVTCGQPLRGHKIRIVDQEGNELAERKEGLLQFQGPSATSGYYRNPEVTRKLFHDEWLNTGDLAYIAEGSIFVTGRSKDVIIRAGRNVYPQEVEETVGNIPGVRKGCVVAFGTKEPSTGTERLAIIAESREQDSKIKQQLQNRITAIASDLIGLPPDEVIIAPPHTVLKTSSGKIRRSACRELYERGHIGKIQKAMWIQIAHTLLRSVLPGWHRLRKLVTDYAYAAYAWALFILLASITWPTVVLLPVISWRWSMLHLFTNIFATFSGTKIMVNGMENILPASQVCVYVSNHASYLDSIAMIAAIPRPFTFVAKTELAQNPFVRVFLQRLHVEFVERFDRQRGVIDAQRIAEAAKRKQLPFFFPEGTFQRVAGLMNFHMGAFMTAAQAGVPVIPIAIRGTRAILRSDSWFPRHGRVTITVGKAISRAELNLDAQADSWQIAVQLRDAARKHILRYCGEPDLAQAVEK